MTELKTCEIVEASPDTWHVPTYTVPEVSRYLGVPSSTVRAWVRGQRYIVAGQERFFRPLIERPDERLSQLSFINVVEVHVLSAIRRVHRVSLQKVRVALDYIETGFGSEHPLATYQFRTDGIDLFIREFDHLVNLSQQGQLVMKAMLEAFLRRVDRNSAGIASRLYPFTRPGDLAGNPASW